MFQIAVQTAGLEEIFGRDSAYRMIAEAGFDAVDADLDHLMKYSDVMEKRIPSCLRPGCTYQEIMEATEPWRAGSKKYGLQNYQAHAPFPSHNNRDITDTAWDNTMLEVLKNTIRAAAAIDCRNLIIHPFFMVYDCRLSREAEWEMNIDRYTRLAPVAKEYGVTINLENMFTSRNGKVYAAVCNDAPMAAKYVDTLNEAAGAKVFGFCLDTGHALLAAHDIRQFMTDLGGRITAFHVHDNDGVNDLHQAPYTGKLDWNRFIEGLRDIGFDKTLSFETFRAVETVDREVIPETLKFISSCGRMFARRASEK